MREAGEDTVKSARTPATAVRRMRARANMSTDIFFAWNGLKGVEVKQRAYVVGQYMFL